MEFSRNQLARPGRSPARELRLLETPRILCSPGKSLRPRTGATKKVSHVSRTDKASAESVGSGGRQSIGEAGDQLGKVTGRRLTTSGSVARASGVHPSGKQRSLETAGPGQKGVFTKRLSHNGTVRVTSFLTSCQVASLTAASVLLCRRQLDVARLLMIAPANDEAGDGVGVDGTKLRRLCHTPVPARAVITTRRPHVDV